MSRLKRYYDYLALPTFEVRSLPHGNIYTGPQSERAKQGLMLDIHRHVQDVFDEAKPGSDPEDIIVMVWNTVFGVIRRCQTYTNDPIWHAADKVRWHVRWNGPSHIEVNLDWSGL